MARSIHQATKAYKHLSSVNEHRANIFTLHYLAKRVQILDTLPALGQVGPGLLALRLSKRKKLLAAIFAVEAAS
jgi:hypothetical protein